MPAGFKYDLNLIEKTMPELCRFETVYRLSGGFNLDTTNLTGIDKIPPMTPLVIDFKTRTAKAVVNVEVYEKYTTGTSMKIKKGSLAYVNMFIGDGTNGAKVTKNRQIERRVRYAYIGCCIRYECYGKRRHCPIRGICSGGNRSKSISQRFELRMDESRSRCNCNSYRTCLRD